VFGGDSLVTFDGALRRVQIFEPGGAFVRSYLLETLGETGMPDKVIATAGDSTLAIRYIDFGTEVPNGIVRWPHEIVATLDLRTGGLDSVAFVPGSEASVVARPNGGYTHGRYIFGKGNEFAAGAGRIAIVSTDTFAVQVVGLDGAPFLSIRRDVQLSPATDQEFDEYVEGTVGLVFPDEEGARGDDAETFRRSLRNAPRASTLPILRSLEMDTQGNLWVERYFHPGEDPLPYMVFRSDGTWLGEVPMPSGLQRGFIAYQAPYLQIGSDFLLGVFTDEMGVQYVRMHGLVKEGGG